MKLKNVLLTGLSFVLVTAVAIGGTLAYLTSTDSDVNVMTLGNVQIEQFEMERVFDENGNVIGMQEFTQAKPLYPAVVTNGSGNAAWQPNNAVDIYYKDYLGDEYPGGNGTWQNLNNVMDKFVFVKNTGKTDAYYRTIILLEADETGSKNAANQCLIHLNTNGHSNFDWSVNGGDFTDTTPVVEIDGEKYWVVVATYNKVLTPGEISRPSLLQVGMDQTATNEFIEQFGDTYDILVLSQAIQAAGFDSAEFALNTGFGETTAENVVAWFSGNEFEKPAVVREAGALNSALEDGKTVYFADDVSAPVEKSAIYGTPTAVVQKNGGVIDGNGNELIVESNAYNAFAIETWGGTIKNLSIKTALGRGIVISAPKSDVYISNVVVNGPGYAINTTEHNGKNLVVNNSTFNGWSSLAGLDSATFNNCSFGENTAKYWQNMGYDKDYDRLIRPYISTEFNSCEFEQDFYIDLSALGADCKVTLDNCTTNGTKITASNYASCIFIELPSGRSLTDCVIFK